MALRTHMLLAATAMAVLLLVGCSVFMPYVQHAVDDKVQELISGVPEDAIVLQRNDPITLADLDSFIYVIDQDAPNEVSSIQPAENKAGAVLSPDGDHVAFLLNDDVYVMDVDGTDRTNITANTFRNEVLNTGLDTGCGQPVWSPDSKRVAFTSYSEKPIYSSSSAEPDIGPAEKVNGIYVANASRLGVPVMISAFSGDVPSTNLTWSPDGEKIASYDAEALNVVKDDKDGQWDLIYHSRSAQPPYSWSSDGKRIAYVDEDDGDIYVMNADGSGQRRLTHTSNIEGYPAWSPDGKRIAYVSVFESDIYVMNADGSGRKRLGNTIRYSSLPATAPDPGDTSVSHPFATWSPDGKTIAFFCPAPPGSKGRYICMNNADGTEWKRLALDVD